MKKITNLMGLFIVISLLILLGCELNKKTHNKSIMSDALETEYIINNFNDLLEKRVLVKGNIYSYDDLDVTVSCTVSLDEKSHIPFHRTNCDFKKLDSIELYPQKNFVNITGFCVVNGTLQKIDETKCGLKGYPCNIPNGYLLLNNSEVVVCSD